MATVTPFPTPPIPPAGIAPAIWGQALDAVYAKAQTAMPELGERLARAMALVRAGAVEHAGQWGAYHYTVASASDPTGLMTYDVHAQAPMSCTCEDHARATKQRKGGSCKHLIATWLYRRALEQVTPALVESATEPQAGDNSREKAPETHALPEAAFSLTLKGLMRGVDSCLTVRGATRTEFLTHLQDVLDLSTQVEAVRGLFDAPAGEIGSPASAPPAAEWVCQYHGKGLPSKKVPGGRYCPAKMADGAHCKEQWAPK